MTSLTDKNWKSDQGHLPHSAMRVLKLQFVLQFLHLMTQCIAYIRQLLVLRVAVPQKLHGLWISAYQRHDVVSNVLRKRALWSVDKALTLQFPKVSSGRWALFVTRPPKEFSNRSESCPRLLFFFDSCDCASWNLASTVTPYSTKIVDCSARMSLQYLMCFEGLLCCCPISLLHCRNEGL